MATTLQVELFPEVEKFLSGGTLGGVVGGKSIAAAGGETFTTINPGSGDLLAEVTSFQTEDVERAIQNSQQTFTSTTWAKMPANERGVLLHRLADAVEARKEIIAQIESLDCGKIYSQAIGDIENFIDTIRYFSDLALHTDLRTVIPVKGYEAWTYKRPYGPCGFIIPWNFPFLLAGWGIGPALAAGNTVVIKPAEDTPLTTIYLGQLAEEIGFPAGVINVVPGLGETAGAALSNSSLIRRMSFTGSPEVGRLVAESCGRNLVPIKCELGGKGAALIFEDVDVSSAAQSLVEAITFHTGQVCCDATRWLIEKPIYDQFVDECVTRMKAIQVGYQLDSASCMGPVVSSVQRDRVLGYLEKGVAGGAEFIVEGGIADVAGYEKGMYVKPALLAGSLDNVAAREEIFGPVAFLAPFEGETQGLEMANDTDYGLANSVWTSDLKRAQRIAESFDAGNGWINAHNLMAHGVPYAGVNKSGMGGGVLSPETLADYWKSISVMRPL